MRDPSLGSGGEIIYRKIDMLFFPWHELLDWDWQTRSQGFRKDLVPIAWR